MATNKCDFLLCNYEVNGLFKFNLSQLFYLDRFNKRFNFNSEYEVKLGKLPLSLNTEMRISLNNSKDILIKSWRDTLINDNPRRIDYEFQDERANNSINMLSISEQVRYYVRMKHRIQKGKNSNNLNGYYIGLAGTYNAYKVSFNNTTARTSIFDLWLFANKKYSYSLSIGNQRQTAKNAFFDYGFKFQPLMFNSIDPNMVVTKVKTVEGNFYLKFGIAK